MARSKTHILGGVAYIRRFKKNNGVLRGCRGRHPCKRSNYGYSRCQCPFLIDRQGQVRFMRWVLAIRKSALDKMIKQLVAERVPAQVTTPHIRWSKETALLRGHVADS